MQRLQTLLFCKKETFLMWNIAFLPIWFPSISPSNTSLRKTLPFCRSDLILVIKLEMRKPPFKRNPYLREKLRLTDISLRSRYYCTWTSDWLGGLGSYFRSRVCCFHSLLGSFNSCRCGFCSHSSDSCLYLAWAKDCFITQDQRPRPRTTFSEGCCDLTRHNLKK